MQIDLFDPGVAAGGLGPFGSEAVPGCAGDVYDSCLVGVQTMRERALMEVEPHASDQVHFGYMRRQLYKGNAVGHLRCGGDVLPGTAKHHRVDVRRQLLGKAAQEHAHGVRQD